MQLAAKNSNIAALEAKEAENAQRITAHEAEDMQRIAAHEAKEVMRKESQKMCIEKNAWEKISLKTLLNLDEERIELIQNGTDSSHMNTMYAVAKVT